MDDRDGVVVIDESRKDEWKADVVGLVAAAGE